MWDSLGFSVWWNVLALASAQQGLRASSMSSRGCGIREICQDNIHFSFFFVALACSTAIPPWGLCVPEEGGGGRGQRCSGRPQPLLSLGVGSGELSPAAVACRGLGFYTRFAPLRKHSLNQKIWQMAACEKKTALQCQTQASTCFHYIYIYKKSTVLFQREIGICFILPWVGLRFLSTSRLKFLGFDRGSAAHHGPPSRSRPSAAA